MVATVFPVVLSTTAPAQAAPVVGFDPGNIISDAAFFNTSTMSVADVQNFLNSKGGTCASGSTCLKDYAQATQNRAADAYCRAYAGSPWESAASIIHKVAQACGVNPQVILVMLQKEQGLITATRPSATAYRSALGMGCPDTAACDAQYYGFGNQVYSGIRQLRVYQLSGRYTWYGPGITAQVRYHPNAACGSSPVYVQNQATAALYYYTPYQPNAAALAAGRGTGDGCSAYGNRNFYTYFTEWFGSPQGFAVVGYFGQYWRANGGAGGFIGSPTSNEQRAAAGPYQRFTGADIFLRAIEGSAAVPVRGALREEYRAIGEWAALGFPIQYESAVGTGAQQRFEQGSVYGNEKSGVFAVGGLFDVAHRAHGGAVGVLGFPVGRSSWSGNGTLQRFQHGSIYARENRDPFVLTAEYDTTYWTSGGPGGVLGYPRTGQVADRVGIHVEFDHGWIQKSGSVVRVAQGAIGKYYVTSGGLDGPLGAIMGDESSQPGGGTSQRFENGTVYTSSTGTFAVLQASPAVAAAGGVAQTGYPLEETRVSGTSWSQRFAQVTFTSSAGAAPVVVRGAIKRLYDSSGGVAGDLGPATGPERALGNGVVQDFVGGRIWCSPTALVATDSRVLAAHTKAGGPSGRLGWPVSARTSEPGGFRQEFQGGSILGSDLASGPVDAVFGMVRSTFLAGGGARAIGFPTTGEFQVAGAVKQVFERGAVYLPLDGRPGGVVQGRIWEAYVAAGAEANTGIGIPVGQATTTRTGSTRQTFSASTFFTTATGTYVVRGLVGKVFQANGGDAGRLGEPLESERLVGAGAVQRFVGGTIHVSPAGSFATWGALGAEHARRGGASGPLGFPVGPEVVGNDRVSQRFQNGTLVLRFDGTFTVE